MSRKRPAGRKVRVDFRQNRQQPRRAEDLTRRFYADPDAVTDSTSGETVRAKGDLSRKRTLIVDHNEVTVVDEALWKRGVVTAVFGLVCEVADDARKAWQCTVRRVQRTLQIAQRSAVTVGDRVWFSDQSRLSAGQDVGVIERIEPRTTRLSRRERTGREHTIVANADQLVIVASLAQPRLKPHLVDRYLAAAANGDLRPIIVFNKADLAELSVDLQDELEQVERSQAAGDQEIAVSAELLRAMTVQEQIAEFETLGYQCIQCSAKTGQGVAELRSALAGHISVLSGQSGVGKSSLINAIQPGLELTVGLVSEENEKGRHTTSHARLLPLESGGFVVDTPGIRQFALWAIQPGELEACFTEFAGLIPRCKFKDCHHLAETGCAVRAAADEGAISPRRYLSYAKMLSELRRGGRDD